MIVACCCCEVSTMAVPYHSRSSLSLGKRGETRAALPIRKGILSWVMNTIRLCGDDERAAMLAIVNAAAVHIAA